MALEIELKVKVADHAHVREQLVRLGASRIALIHETNIFLDTSDQRLQTAGQGLRIRLERRDDQTPPTVIITHKGPRVTGPFKTREETELEVASVDGAIALFGALGFDVTLRFEKQRERWSLDGCHIELDTLPVADLGVYVEIEGPTEAAVTALRDKLGLHDHPMVQASYAKLLADYAAANGAPREFAFAEPGP